MTVSIENYGVVLTPVAVEDLEMIRQWRNHPDVASYMFNTAMISADQQRQWFDNIRQDVHQQHYVIYYSNEAIGVINGKSLDMKPLAESTMIEVGMYIAPEGRYRGTVLAFCPALAFNYHCFSVWHCETLRAEVLPGNTAALRFNQQLGYSEIARDSSKVVMQLTAENFQAACDRMSPLIRF